MIVAAPPTHGAVQCALAQRFRRRELRPALNYWVQPNRRRCLITSATPSDTMHSQPAAPEWILTGTSGEKICSTCSSKCANCTMQRRSTRLPYNVRDAPSL